MQDARLVPAARGTRYITCLIAAQRLSARARNGLTSRALPIVLLFIIFAMLRMPSETSEASARNLPLLAT
jgi:hypothetical protein